MIFENILPLIAGIIGSVIGIGISWGTMHQKISVLEERLVVLMARVLILENDRIQLADRLARIETKLDEIKEQLSKTN